MKTGLDASGIVPLASPLIPLFFTGNAVSGSFLFGKQVLELAKACCLSTSVALGDEIGDCPLVLRRLVGVVAEAEGAVADGCGLRRRNPEHLAGRINNFPPVLGLAADVLGHALLCDVAAQSCPVLLLVLSSDELGVVQLLVVLGLGGHLLGELHFRDADPLQLPLLRGFLLLLEVALLPHLVRILATAQQLPVLIALGLLLLALANPKPLVRSLDLVEGRVCVGTELQNCLCAIAVPLLLRLHHSAPCNCEDAAALADLLALWPALPASLGPRSASAAWSRTRLQSSWPLPLPCLRASGLCGSSPQISGPYQPVWCQHEPCPVPCCPAPAGGRYTRRALLPLPSSAPSTPLPRPQRRPPGRRVGPVPPSSGHSVPTDDRQSASAVPGRPPWPPPAAAPGPPGDPPLARRRASAPRPWSSGPPLPSGAAGPCDGSGSRTDQPVPRTALPPWSPPVEKARYGQSGPCRKDGAGQ
eukprot:scaffold680_cov264-Pinguiococcus_pyrenoidosus.AAC.24